MGEFLYNHWHCILPVIAIIIAMFFIRDKDTDGKKKDKRDNIGDN